MALSGERLQPTKVNQQMKQLRLPGFDERKEWPDNVAQVKSESEFSRLMALVRLQEDVNKDPKQ